MAWQGLVERLRSTFQSMSSFQTTKGIILLEKLSNWGALEASKPNTTDAPERRELLIEI